MEFIFAYDVKLNRDQNNGILKIFIIYLFGYTGSLLQHVGSSSLNGDRTWVPCIGSVES